MAIEYAYVATQASTNGRAQVGGDVIHREYRCASAKGTELATLPVREEEGGMFVSYRDSTRKVRWCKRCEKRPPLDWGWQDRAECLNAWPLADMIEMPRGNHNRIDELIARFCDHCPVTAACARFALDSIEDAQGIWGGVFVQPNVGGKNRERRVRAIKRLRKVAATLPGDAA
jgi:hypothetical protein